MRLDLDLFPLITSRKSILFINKLIQKEFQNLKLDKILRDADKTPNIRELFWMVLFYNNINRDVLNKNNVKKLIFEHRSGEGGFFETNKKYPDIKTTYKCLVILYFINAELNLDEKRMITLFIKKLIDRYGLTRHCFNRKCKCSGKSSIEFTFYAISSLILLDSLNELDENKIKALTTTKILYSENKLVYRLLVNHLLYSKQQLDKRKIIRRFQRSTEISNYSALYKPETIDDTIFNIHYLKIMNYLSEIELGRIYEMNLKPILFEIFTKFDTKNKVSTELLFKILILLYLITDNLLEVLEIRLFKEFSRSYFIRLEPISERYKVSKELLNNVVSLTSEKYKWFDIKRVTYKELFNKFTNNFKEPVEKIIKNLEDKIIDKNLYKIRFNQLSKELNLPIDKIKESISILIEYGLIFGQIKSSYLKISTIPETFLILKKKIPIKDVLQEKTDIGLLKIKILELIKEFKTYPEDFGNSIEYFINIDELDLAESKISKNIKNYYLLLDSKIEQIENKVKDLKFFSIDDLTFYSELHQTADDIKDTLEEKKKELSIQIKKQKKIFNAYSEIANFIDSFTEEQQNLKKQLEELFSTFFKSCKEKTIDKKKDEFLQDIKEIENRFKLLISKLESNKKHFINLTTRIKLFSNFIIIDDKKFDSTHQLSLELKSGNPFDLWMKNYWDVKKNYLLKKINEFQSYVYNREQIIEIIDEKKLMFKELYEQLSSNLDPAKKLDLLLKIDDKILEVDKNIKEIASDTSKILENFPEVILDVNESWKSFKEEFLKLLQPIKENVEVQILSVNKIKLKLDIEKKIENKINNFQKQIAELDKLAKKNWIKSKITLLGSFNEKIKGQYKELKEFDDELKTIFKKYEAEFKNVEQFLSISMNKWQDFFSSIEKIYREKRSRLIKSVLYSFISNQNIMKGGRISLDFISSKLDLDVETIKKILERSMELYDVDVIFTENNQIIPLFDNNLKLWKFENFLISSKQEFQTNREEIMKVFMKIVDKKAIRLNETELKKYIEIYKERLNIVIGEFNKEGKTHLKVEHLKNLLEDWNSEKQQLINTINNIESILNEREEIEEYYDELFITINNKFETIKNLKELSQRKEILNMYDEMDYLLNTLEFEKTSPTNLNYFKPKIDGLGNYLSDLEESINKKFDKMIESIKAFQKVSNDKYRELLEGICLCDINQQINEFKNEFKVKLENIDQEIKMIKAKNDKKALKNAFKKYSKELEIYLNETQVKLKKFIEFVEEERGLKYFRYDSKFVLQDWNVEEILEGIRIYFKTF
ncbi:MAG: hypothetical protein ACTSVY_01965 [Candidatus Helarchaeota archaeon]